LNGLDLFSGIGGLTIALNKWVEPVAYCEKEKFAQAVLLQRISSTEIPRAPIWDDVRTLRGAMLPRIDIIYGGFPCQDISSAGRGKGLAGERSGLFFEIVRLTKETRAPFVFLENVPAIRTRGLQTVVDAFTDIRYDCRWTCISASEVGAPHLRKRWFLLAKASNVETLQRQKIKRHESNGNNERAKTLADSHRKSIRNESGRCSRTNRKEETIFGRRHKITPNTASGGRKQGPKNTRRSKSRDSSKKIERGRFADCDRWWSIEPNVGRVAHGVSKRVDRLRGLGNAVVPLQAKTAFERLLLGET
jgi:DNA (cytosine-5)-methyltransferase 1